MSIRKKYIWFAVLFFLLYNMTCWIRIQGVDRIPAGQFTETDGYFYYWQSKLILENGKLPKRDMHRWLPVGRDLGQTLNAYPYFVAYSYKLISLVFSKVTLYQWCFYFPVGCFLIAFIIGCVFVYRIHGFLFACIFGFIWTTLPSVIERTSSGFGDRDAWCLLIGMSCLVTYLISLKENGGSTSRIIWTVFSGLLTLIGCYSWEGFGIFLGIIAALELWRYLSTHDNSDVKYYLLWTTSFIPCLFFHPAYHSGYGFARYLSVFVITPPLSILLLRFISYRFSLWDRFKEHVHTINLISILTVLSIGIIYVFTQITGIKNTSVFSDSDSVILAMTELGDADFYFWWMRYGNIFIISAIGAILFAIRSFRIYGWVLGASIGLFVCNTYFREFSDMLWGMTTGNIVFGASVALCACSFILICYKRRPENYKHFVTIGFLIWYLTWIGLTRGGKRYDTFTGIASAYFTADLIIYLSQIISRKLRYSVYVTDKFRQDFSFNKIFYTLITLAFLAISLFPLNVAHLYRSIPASKSWRSPKPGLTHVNTAFLWMKLNLKGDAVMAGHWAYGSQLNVLGNVKTIVDQDTFIPFWVTLYDRHIHEAEDEQEMLVFLKSHEATHIMYAPKDTRDSYLVNTELSDAFIPVYPDEQRFDKSRIKVWRIAYPKDIKPHPIYTETGFLD